MFLLIIGIATAFNFMVIKYKVEKERYLDAILDLFTLSILSFIFMGTYDGLVVSTIASAIISVYLYFVPPKIPERVIKWFERL